MSCGIYIITNNITGKSYVGQSSNIEKRMINHKNQSDLKTSYLEKSIRKHGWSNFNWDILYECSQEELDLEERKFVALYNTYHDGYNLTRGGEFKGYGNPMHNPVLKQKNIESRKGFKHSVETKLAMSQKINTTGFYHVFKEYDDKLVKGFCYRYECKGHNPIRSVDITRLEKKVLAKGWEWIIVNEELAELTLRESESNRKEYNKKHTTGYAYVSKCYSDDYSNGYYYRYAHWENGKVSYVQAVTIPKLKEKVLNKNWKWIKLNNNLDDEINELNGVELE